MNPNSNRDCAPLTPEAIQASIDSIKGTQDEPLRIEVSAEGFVAEAFRAGRITWAEHQVCMASIIENGGVLIVPPDSGIEKKLIP